MKKDGIDRSNDFDISMNIQQLSGRASHHERNITNNSLNVTENETSAISPAALGLMSSSNISSGRKNRLNNSNSSNANAQKSLAKQSTESPLRKHSLIGHDGAGRQMDLQHVPRKIYQ